MEIDIVEFNGINQRRNETIKWSDAKKTRKLEITIDPGWPRRMKSLTDIKNVENWPPHPPKKKLTHAEGIDAKMFLTHATYLNIMTDLQFWGTQDKVETIFWVWRLFIRRAN